MLRAATLLLSLASVSVAHAAPPFAGDEVYGSEAGCQWLATRTFPGSEDTMVVTRDYMRGYESMCHFVDTKPGVHEDLFVSALCYGEGEMWPAIYAFALNPDTGALIMMSQGGASRDDLAACPGMTGAKADAIVGE